MRGADFQLAVVGAGPIGSAAARHLAQESASVVLIGPDEPATFHDHEGPWSGWFDEGRMAHTIDLPLLSGLIGLRARRWFDTLQQDTGIAFAHSVPALTVAPDWSRVPRPADAADEGAEYFNMHGMLTRAQDLGVRAEHLDESALRTAFPEMSFAPGHMAIHQPEALLINPRRLVKAETTAAVNAGAARVVGEVAAIERGAAGHSLAMSNGERVTARRVVLAAGAYINLAGLAPKPLDFWTFGATVALAAVDPDTSQFPTTMYYKSTADAPYAGIIAPPLPYPDGRCCIKGSGDSLLEAPLESAAAAEQWVRTGGDSRDVERLARVLSELLPGVQLHDITTRPCMVTINATGYPYIGFIDDDVVVATEGEHGVTMADEIGRLAARLATDGTWTDSLPPEPFAPRFR